MLARVSPARVGGFERVAGVVVGGSTARAQADQFSDAELMILWSGAPGAMGPRVRTKGNADDQALRARFES